MVTIIGMAILVSLSLSAMLVVSIISWINDEIYYHKELKLIKKRLKVARRMEKRRKDFHIYTLKKEKDKYIWN